MRSFGGAEADTNIIDDKKKSTRFGKVKIYSLVNNTDTWAHIETMASKPLEDRFQTAYILVLEAEEEASLGANIVYRSRHYYVR